jgi:hypothetical protein
VRINFLYFLFWRTGQVLLENFSLLLGSLGLKVPKQLLLPREAEALFRVRDKESV